MSGSGQLDPVTGWSAVCYLVAKEGPGGLEPRGTAFALGGDLVASALHVVGVDSQSVSLAFARGDFNGYQDTTTENIRFVTASVVEVDPVRDLAILRINGGIATQVEHNLGSADDVVPGARLISYGYPHADVGRVVLTQHDAPVGAKILLENQGQKVKHLVVNCLLRPGQSGGPVIDPIGRRVVGVLVGPFAHGGGGGISLGGIDPAALHQTTHAVSAEYLKAMI